MNNTLPDVIVEFANSHSGDQEVLYKMVDEVAKFSYPNRGIKFQVFSPEGIALEDFEWFEVYQEITFNTKFWNELISYTFEKVKVIWIDIFDLFGLEVIEQNDNKIYGIKLQASVIENYEIRQKLQAMDISNKRLMINVSGFQLDKITQLIEEFNQLNPKELILQVGFQSYPTKIEDTGLNKIKILKNLFSNKVCLAEHIDAETEAAIDVPIYGVASGAGIIEKHFCLNRKESKYDHYSSLTVNEFERLFEKLTTYQLAFSSPFISDAETKYLEGSIQVPVLAKEMCSGDLVSVEDVIFRRTTQKGLVFSDIQSLQKQFYLLNNSVSQNLTVLERNFKAANIAVIVAGRMKSSRLKKKAILPIGNIPSITMCLESCLKMPYASQVILATSTTEADSVLQEYLPQNQNVGFYQGEPDDVIKRYIGACNEYGVDVAIRVTADCPFISREISETLLKAHFESGADYTAAIESSVGTSCEIINVSALKKVIEIAGNAEMSEYMTWYFQNNPDIFKVNLVNLPTELVRSYRLTLDYEEDLQMFNSVVTELNGKDITLENVFSVLDNQSHIPKMNGHLTLKYKTDQALIDKLNKATRLKK